MHTIMMHMWGVEGTLPRLRVVPELCFRLGSVAAEAGLGCESKEVVMSGGGGALRERYAPAKAMAGAPLGGCGL